MEFSIKELREWNKKIENKAHEAGLDFYPQEFEICSYEDMISYEAYDGMPSRYPHWSFGKSYERIKTFYRYNITGLPYELVINSNPCLAFLMRDNSLLLQVLTMAHVYGHNDFFKNNRLFKDGTKAEMTIEQFKDRAERIRGYISNLDIGYERVEKILNAAHALKLQTSRIIGEKKISRDEQIKRIKERYKPGPKQFQLLEKDEPEQLPDFNKIPLQPEEDLLSFFVEYGELEEWEKDILQIVIDETRYFIPQIETKIMNEGWATFWHNYILKKLELPQGMYLEFLKRHNQLVCPIPGGLNPYYVGFMIFTELEKKYSDSSELLFTVREYERDESFIRKYLTFELIKEMDLLQYREEEKFYLITEVGDEEGWKKIRNNLAGSVGLNSVPVIKVVDTKKRDHILCLEHEYRERELEINYARETLKYIVDLWKGAVHLKTTIDDKTKLIICDEEKKISIKDSK